MSILPSLLAPLGHVARNTALHELRQAVNGQSPDPEDMRVKLLNLLWVVHCGLPQTIPQMEATALFEKACKAEDAPTSDIISPFTIMPSGVDQEIKRCHLLNAMDVIYRESINTDLELFMQTAQDALELTRPILYPQESSILVDLANEGNIISPTYNGALRTERIWLTALRNHPTQCLINDAAQYGSTAAVQLEAISQPLADANTMHLAAQHGLTTNVQLAAINDARADTVTVRDAAFYGHTEEVQLAAVRHPLADALTMTWAVLNGCTAAVQLEAVNHASAEAQTIAHAATYGYTEEVQLAALNNAHATINAINNAAYNPRTLAVAVAALTSNQATNNTATNFLAFVEAQGWPAETALLYLQDVLQQVAAQGGASPDHINILNTLYAAYDPTNDAANDLAAAETRSLNLSLLSNIALITNETITLPSANAATTAIVARYTKDAHAISAADIALNALLHPKKTEHTTHAFVARALSDRQHNNSAMVTCLTLHIYQNLTDERCATWLGILQNIMPAEMPDFANLNLA